MAIQYVGGMAIPFSPASSTSPGAISLSGLSGGLASSPATDDLVLITYGSGAQSGGSLGANTVSGYAQDAVCEAVTSGQSSKVTLNWKFMGATPDTTFSPSPTMRTDAGAVFVVQVFRGVDKTTPFDVASQISAVTGSKPNPPPITPSTPGAVIIAGGAVQLGFTSNPSLSSSLTAFVTARADETANDVAAGAGYYASWTSGAYDPAEFGNSFSTASTSVGSAAYTAALRPASGGGAQTITGAGFDDGEAFGASTVSSSYTITGAGFDDGDDFGAATISQPPAAQTITGAGFDDGDDFGSATITQAAPPAPVTDFISGGGIPEEELRRFFAAQEAPEEPRPTDFRKTLEIAAGLRQADAPEAIEEAIEEIREAAAPADMAPLLAAVEQMRAAAADAEALARFERLAARLGEIAEQMRREDDEDVALILTVM